MQDNRTALENEVRMKRGILACAATVLCLPTYFVYLMHLPPHVASLDEITRWQPDAIAIRSSLHTRYGKNIPADNLEAKQMFAMSFQQRYRDHAIQLAVRLKFCPDGTVRLLLPSRLEPWYMDKIALAAYRETRDTFHQKQPIGLYETFAGAAPVHIGQVSADTNDPTLIRVTFDYTLSPNRFRLIK